MDLSRNKGRNKSRFHDHQRQFSWIVRHALTKSYSSQFTDFYALDTVIGRDLTSIDRRINMRKRERGTLSRARSMYQLGGQGHERSKARSAYDVWKEIDQVKVKVRSSLLSLRRLTPTSSNDAVLSLSAQYNALVAAADTPKACSEPEQTLDWFVELFERVDQRVRLSSQLRNDLYIPPGECGAGLGSSVTRRPSLSALARAPQRSKLNARKLAIYGLDN